MGYEKGKQQSARDNRKKADGDKLRDKLAFGDYRFVRIELSAEEKEHAREYIAEATFGLETADRYLETGYTVKFSSDKKGGGKLCAVTCSDSDSGDRGLILTARGSTATIAWLMFLYKDLAICADRSWLQAESERGGSYDDIG